MLDLNELVGLELSKAKKILQKNGIESINIVDNFIRNDLCDTKIVCSAKQTDNCVTLVCGEFYLDVKE